MSDNRAKVCSILLKMRGKTRLISLHDFASFSGQSEDAGLYRARIDGCWHCPDGKYTAIGPDAVAEFLHHAPEASKSRCASSPIGSPVKMIPAAVGHGQKHRRIWAQTDGGGYG